MPSGNFDRGGFIQSLVNYWWRSRDTHEKMREKISMEYLSKPKSVDRSHVIKPFLDNPLGVDNDAKAALLSPNFNCWRAGKDPQLLLRLAYYMLTQTSQNLPVSPCLRAGFIAEIYCNYNENPYHNILHAFSVTQMMYCFLNSGCQCPLTDVEKYACMLAALCHDLDHPGLSNSYQFARNSSLARHYEVSPLENHHVAVTMEILANRNSDALFGLNDSDQEQIKKLLHDLILATDMERLHMRLVEDFSTMKNSLNMNQYEHRVLLMKIMLKACDVSNEGRPWPISYPWGVCVQQEFYSEGDLRLGHDLPVPHQMDRVKNNVLQGQLTFITFVALPLYHLVEQYLGCSGLVHNALCNVQFYCQLLESNGTDSDLMRHVQSQIDSIATEPFYVTLPAYPVLDQSFEPSKAPTPLQPSPIMCNESPRTNNHDTFNVGTANKSSLLQRKKTVSKAPTQQQPDMPWATAAPSSPQLGPGHGTSSISWQDWSMATTAAQVRIDHTAALPCRTAGQRSLSMDEGIQFFNENVDDEINPPEVVESEAATLGCPKNHLGRMQSEVLREEKPKKSRTNRVTVAV